MRLHAITAVHGQDGLHERLLIEPARFPPLTAPASGLRWR
jgi:hypothetical protein